MLRNLRNFSQSEETIKQVPLKGAKKSREGENIQMTNEDDKTESTSTLECYFAGYEKVTIDQPFQIFNDKILADKSNPNLDVSQGGVDYGVLKFLEGDWYSYIESDSKRVSNIKDGVFKPNFGSGIHTTIMPSPGTTQNNIPGKFSFECDEYIEKLSFDLVPGGVRNRGGANEQFCGAVKYEQTIRRIDNDIHSYNDAIKNLLRTKSDNILNVVWEKVKDEDIIKFKNEQCASFNQRYKDKTSKEVLLLLIKIQPGIHEENGMYLWLSDVMKNPATEDSIKKDRGVHNWDNEQGRAILFKRLYGTDEKIENIKKEIENQLDNISLEEFNKIKSHIESSFEKNIEKLIFEYRSIDGLKEILGINKVFSKENLKKYEVLIELLIQFFLLNYFRPIQIVELDKIVKLHPFLDITLYNIGSLFIPRYVIDKPTDLSTIKSIVPAKELQPGEGIDRPTFVPDYSISRSGVIPHGSTITLLGDLQREAGSFLIKREPMFVNPTIGTWDYDHLAVSPTMGGATSPSDDKRPFDLYNPPLPFAPTEGLNALNDEGENLVYSQQLFLHNLYPYSVRPDLRLRDTIKNQNIKNHIRVEMFSKKDEGAQGGIVNIPFVNRFVPTVNMKMNMWLETVVEDGKEILQLQYEQIVFFEFGFGDGGGTTSWPHIQVNTLRQFKDLNKYSQELAYQQFIQPEQEALRKKVEKQQELKIAEAGKCPFGHTSKK